MKVIHSIIILMLYIMSCGCAIFEEMDYAIWFAIIGCINIILYVAIDE